MNQLFFVVVDGVVCLTPVLPMLAIAALYGIASAMIKLADGGRK